MVDEDEREGGPHTDDVESLRSAQQNAQNAGGAVGALAAAIARLSPSRYLSRGHGADLISTHTNAPSEDEISEPEPPARRVALDSAFVVRPEVSRARVPGGFLGDYERRIQSQISEQMREAMNEELRAFGTVHADAVVRRHLESETEYLVREQATALTIRVPEGAEHEELAEYIRRGLRNAVEQGGLSAMPSQIKINYRADTPPLEGFNPAPGARSGTLPPRRRSRRIKPLRKRPKSATQEPQEGGR